MYAHTDVSKITCFVDDNVAGALDTVLQTLEIPEVYVQRAKQVTLVDRFGFMRFHTYTTSEENRAWLYRFYVPECFASGVMRRVAEAADLYLPGRGSIYSREVKLLRQNPLAFNEQRLSEMCGTEKLVDENYDVLACIMPRGMGLAISEAILEIGLSVPLISFAEGMGSRNQMGLLRITVPVEKEIIFFLIPKIDAEFLKNIIIRKARLDLPGRGFLYQFHVSAQAVNLRCRRGSRTSAATMEQVITALDQLRGSSEWRRLGVFPDKKTTSAKGDGKESISCFSFIMDEGQVAPYVATALVSGAGGATRIPLFFRSHTPQEQDDVRTSAAKEICDLVMPNTICETLIKDIKKSDFFDRRGMIELTSVHNVVTYSGRERTQKNSKLIR